jgi:anti-sigma factor RsiW
MHRVHRGFAAAPLLPNLPLDGVKLTGVRAMPGETGQRLCLFYTRQETDNFTLCVEKTPGPSDAAARLSGSFPARTIAWRQKGANYALTGGLPEPELRALAEAVRAQVEAFDGK